MEIYEDENKSDLLGDIPELDVDEFFESEEEGNSVEEAQESKEGEENSHAREVKPTKPKKVVQNPQPKLNFEALQGSKGLTALNKHFEKFKFRGDKYEKEDLTETMKFLEQWAYRLYPKFHFEDSLQRLESLGKKKIVQTYLKKLRLGMGDGEDVICQQDDEDCKESDHIGNLPNGEGDLGFQENAFDLMLSQEVEKNTNPKTVTLTQDQIDLIELKRKQALEKRLAKMQESNAGTNQLQDQRLDLGNEQD